MLGPKVLVQDMADEAEEEMLGPKVLDQDMAEEVEKEMPGTKCWIKIWPRKCDHIKRL